MYIDLYVITQNKLLVIMSVCRGRGNIVESRIFSIVILPLTLHSNKTG